MCVADPCASGASDSEIAEWFRNRPEAERRVSSTDASPASPQTPPYAKPAVMPGSPPIMRLNTAAQHESSWGKVRRAAFSASPSYNLYGVRRNSYATALLTRGLSAGVDETAIVRGPLQIKISLSVHNVFDIQETEQTFRAKFFYMLQWEVSAHLSRRLLVTMRDCFLSLLCYLLAAASLSTFASLLPFTRSCCCRSAETMNGQPG